MFGLARHIREEARWSFNKRAKPPSASVINRSTNEIDITERSHLVEIFIRKSNYDFTRHSAHSMYYGPRYKRLPNADDEEARRKSFFESYKRQEIGTTERLRAAYNFIVDFKEHHLGYKSTILNVHCETLDETRMQCRGDDLGLGLPLRDLQYSAIMSEAHVLSFKIWRKSTSTDPAVELGSEVILAEFTNMND